jgi:hypothetical protein
MEPANQCDLEEHYDLLHDFDETLFDSLGGKENVMKIKNIVPVKIEENKITMIANINGILFLSNKLKELKEEKDITTCNRMEHERAVPMFTISFGYPLSQSKLLKSIYK